MDRINIVVSCTAGKYLPSEHREYDRYKGDPERWLADADNMNEKYKMRADELYKGPGADKFRAIKEMIEDEGYAVDLWILSAGFGLIKGDTMLPGYDATFSSMAKFNRVRPADYDTWLGGVTRQELPEDSLILLPNSYLKPFKVLVDPDDHYQFGPFGGEAREMIGCSMIRVQLEASYKIIEYGLANDIPAAKWCDIPLEQVL